MEASTEESNDRHWFEAQGGQRFGERCSLLTFPVQQFEVGGVPINPVTPHPGQLAHQPLFDHRAEHPVDCVRALAGGGADGGDGRHRAAEQRMVEGRNACFLTRLVGDPVLKWCLSSVLGLC